MKEVYISIDLHSKTSVTGYMNEQGEYLGQQRFATSGTNLINQVVAMPADYKYLTIEQGNMAFWAAELLQDFVDELIICDPRHNALIGRNDNKSDELDTLRLCKLLRMGELKTVWNPKQMGVRRLFYQQVKEYQRLVRTMTIHKRQLQDMLRHWGYNISLKKKDYTNPDQLLQQVKQPLLTKELRAKFAFVGLLVRQKDEQLQRVEETGKRFREISEFMKMPGIGPVGAHVFSGYIQNPHRFRRRGQLIRFCQLSVNKKTSDRRRLKSERLSKAGHGCLKNVAHTSWKAAMTSDNEVSRFYQASLQRCGNKDKARLNTQRKILITLWALWKNNQPYQPEKFFSGNGVPTR